MSNKCHIELGIMSYERAAAYETMELREHRVRCGLSDEHFIADPVNLPCGRGYAPAGAYKAMEFFYYSPILDGDGPNFDDPVTMDRRKTGRLHIHGDYS